MIRRIDATAKKDRRTIKGTTRIKPMRHKCDPMKPCPKCKKKRHSDQQSCRGEASNMMRTKTCKHNDLFGIGKKSGPDAYDIVQKEITAFLEYYKKAKPYFSKLNSVKAIVESGDCNKIATDAAIVKGLCERMMQLMVQADKKLTAAGLV